MDRKTEDDLRALSGSVPLTEKLLRWVRRKDLCAPAAILLELHRPLMPLAWPMAMLFGGMIAPLYGPDYYEKIEALRDPQLLDRLLKRLESGAGEADNDEAAPSA